MGAAVLKITILDLQESSIWFSFFSSYILKAYTEVPKLQKWFLQRIKKAFIN